MRLRIISVAILAICAALLAFSLAQADNEHTPGAQAQTNALAEYEIDVLSAVSSGTLIQTSGWHLYNPAIDIWIRATTPAYAKFRVVQSHSRPITKIAKELGSN